MTAQRSYKYRDPLEVLELEERRRCTGCEHKAKFLGVELCRHPNRTGKAVNRCKYYSTGEESK